MPLTTWLLAIYLVSQAETGLSAPALKRQLGVSYPTAWLVHYEIMCAMAEREDAHRLTNVVRMDDAYLGGELSGGTAGRGSENKVPFVAAVPLTLVAGFTRDAIKAWANLHLAPGTVVTGDGLSCFAAVTDARCVHVPTVVGGRKLRDLPEFAWVNTILGNLKTMLAGAHHAFNHCKYADNYLAGFGCRFNRRFDFHTLVIRLIVAVARGTLPAGAGHSAG